MINDFLKATGELDVKLIGPDGNLKEEIHIPNTVVTVGKEWIAARMKDTGITTQMTHMAVGTNGGSVGDVAQTDLLAEVASSRTALATAGGTVTNNQVVYECTFAPGVGDGVLQEAGIFNAATPATTVDSVVGGIMLCRTTFGSVTKGSGDTLVITWTVTIN